jgi:hypothetical protein
MGCRGFDNRGIEIRIPENVQRGHENNRHCFVYSIGVLVAKTTPRPPVSQFADAAAAAA